MWELLAVFALAGPEPEWSWHDRIAWVSGLVLTAFLIWGVLVARKGVLVARKTLQAIVRQTKAAEDAAKLGKENMEILISKERAKIVLVEEFPRPVPSLVPGYSRKLVIWKEGEPPASLESDEFMVRSSRMSRCSHLCSGSFCKWPSLFL
jgi:hypothetical protein